MRAPCPLYFRDVRVLVHLHGRTPPCVNSMTVHVSPPSALAGSECTTSNVSARADFHRASAGLGERLRAAEEAKGITPDPEVADLMDRAQSDTDYVTNVNIVLQVCAPCVPLV